MALFNSVSAGAYSGTRAMAIPAYGYDWEIREVEKRPFAPPANIPQPAAAKFAARAALAKSQRFRFARICKA